jgi:hypothetical protein
MKINKEYSMLFIIGLFILGYLLDLIVTPLDITLASPYVFFKSDLIWTFPFSTTSIFIKALALFLTPLWLFSFFSSKGFAKPIILLIWAGLIQLYATQDIKTGSILLPLEWSLALAAAGFVLFIPTVYLFIKALLSSVRNNFTNAMQEAISQAKIEEEEASKE